MLHDIANEPQITLNEAAKLFPPNRRGRKPHLSTIYRYTVTGKRGVVLEHLDAGPRRVTSREAVLRFFIALTAKKRQAPVLTHDGQRQAQAAGERLRATVFARKSQ